MTNQQQLLIFRSLLALLVTQKKLVEDSNVNQRYSENLDPLIKQVNDEVNRLLKLNNG